MATALDELPFSQHRLHTSRLVLAAWPAGDTTWFEDKRVTPDCSTTAPAAPYQQ